MAGSRVAHTDFGVRAIMIAEHIRWLRDQVAEPTTPMHIVKLVYIAHGWTLGWFGRSLVRERVEAWRYGPVIPAVYHSYKAFGTQPVMMFTESREDVLDSEQLMVVRAVERGYRRFSALQLSAMTHEPGSPWDVTVKKHGLTNAVIPNSLIQSYYEARADRSS